MNYFFTEKVVKYCAKKMEGQKKQLAAIGAILLGLAGMIGYLYPDAGGFSMEFEQAVKSIMDGLTALGFGQ